MPRAADAYAPTHKWRGWILAAHGHGPDWARVFGLGPNEVDQIWRSMVAAIGDAPVSTIRDRGAHGVVCGIEMELTLNDRTV
jgi:hypothetical protein